MTYLSQCLRNRKDLSPPVPGRFDGYRDHRRIESVAGGQVLRTPGDGGERPSGQARCQFAWPRRDPSYTHRRPGWTRESAGHADCLLASARSTLGQHADSVLTVLDFESLIGTLVGRRKCLQPGTSRCGAGWTRTSDQRIMKLLCQATLRRASFLPSRSRIIHRCTTLLRLRLRVRIASFFV